MLGSGQIEKQEPLPVEELPSSSVLAGGGEDPSESDDKGGAKEQARVSTTIFAVAALIGASLVL